MTAGALALATLVLTAAATASAQQVAAGHPLIEAVELRSDVPARDREEIWRLVTLRPGEPLSEQDVAETLRNLAASGLTQDVRIFRQPSDGGVTLVVAAWGRIRVAEVRLTGDLGLAEEDLRAAVEVRPGEPLSESGVLRSVFALQDLYEESGYLEADSRVRVEHDEAAKTAVVTFRLRAGPPARIADFRFEGDYGPISGAELVDMLRLKAGDRLRPRSGRENARRLERSLIDRGYRSARVEYGGYELHPESDTATLVWQIELGPRVELTVRGVERRDLERRDLLPFMGPEGYDEALLLQAVDRIRDHYQRRGHWAVQVEQEERRQDGVVRIVLTVDPGPVFTLESVAFEGNETFSGERLRQLVATTPRRLTVPGSGRLVQSGLGADLNNLRTFYVLQGFDNAEVGPPRITQASESLALTIPIREGRRRRVAQVELRGVEALDAEDLKRSLPLTAGGAYHPQHLDDSLDLVRSRYEDAGYPWAQVEADVEWNADGTVAAVRFEVLEGPQVVVDRVIVRGLERTNEAVVRRALGVERGEPMSIRRRLEMQRRLYQLGVFSHAEVRLAPGTPYERQRDVLVRVEEGANRRFTYGFGYDSEQGPRGLLGLGWNNLFGRAIQMQGEAKGNDEEHQMRLLARQPYLGRFPLPVTASLFRVQEDHDEFLSKRRGAQVQVERLFDERWRLSLLYSYRVVEVEPGPAFDPLLIDRELRDVDVASLTPGLLFDDRDDPIDPRRGWSANLQLERAFPLFAADEEFLKLFLHGTAYKNLGRPGLLAASLRLGAIEPLAELGRDPIVPPELPSSGVPISERFFAGGRASHRAYGRDDLGVPRQTLLLSTVDGEEQLVPVGGNALALLNLDYRFPIAGALEGVVFFDHGNVWADWDNIVLDEAKPGAGVGLRYRSPIGPVRLEIGWKLDRRGAGDGLPAEDPYEVFFSFGNPF
ncbi:MAG: POTRA domain-containing protein [Thermoanaerobaculia bacterium]